MKRLCSFSGRLLAFGFLVALLVPFLAVPEAFAGGVQAVQVVQRRGLVFPRVTRTRAVPLRASNPLAIQVPFHGAPLAIEVPHACGQLQAIQTPTGTLFLRR